MQHRSGTTTACIEACLQRAEICDKCAADCTKLGDMKNCVEACQRCAEGWPKMTH